MTDAHRKARALMRNAGIDVTMGTAGEVLLQPTTTTALIAEGWQRVIDDLAAGQGPSRPGARLLLSLAARDAVVSQEALLAAVTTGQVWHDGSAVYLEWSDDDGLWRDRRRLSSVTVDLLRGGLPAIGRLDWVSAARWVAARIDPGGRETIDRMLAAAAAWWVDRLPAGLAFHACGIEPFQLLPRSAHARRVGAVHVPRPTGPTLPEDDDDEALPSTAASDDSTSPQGADSTGIAAAGGHIGAMLDAAVGQTTSLKCLYAIRDIARHATSLRQSNAATRAQICRALGDLMPTAAHDGRIQAFMVAAVYSIVAEGGIRGRLLGARALAAYLSTTVVALGSALVTRGEDPVSLDREAWLSVYATVLGPLDGQPRAKARACLLAFHRFVIARGGVIVDGLSGDPSQDAPPFARIVWPEEVEDAVQRIQATPLDARLRLQAVAALRVMATRAVRPEELSTLRIRDVIDHGDGMSLASAPIPSDGVGKSTSARQRQQVTDSATMAALLDLRRARLTALAQDHHHLFGSPEAPDQPWRWADTIQLICRALREATGDPTVASYALRHGVVSSAMARGWTPGRLPDDSHPVAQVSSLAGHAVMASTRSYVHLLEDPLFGWARLAVPDHDPVVLDGIAHVADGLTPRVRISGSVQEERPHAALLPSTVPLMRVLSVLDDRAQDMDVATIAHRWFLPPETVRRLLEHADRSLRLARLAPRGGGRAAGRPSAVETFDTWWRAAQEPKWSCVAEHLARMPAAMGRKLVEAFLECARPRSLSLDEPDLAAPLVDALLDATRSDPAVRVVIRVCGGRVDGRVHHWAGRGAVIETGEYRRGEPRLRLLLCQTATPNGRGRGHSVHGLYGLLVALGASLDLEEREASR